jgi:hypothetical protein
LSFPSSTRPTSYSSSSRSSIIQISQFNAVLKLKELKKRYAQTMNTITLIIEHYFDDIINFHSTNNKECVFQWNRWRR